MRKALSALVLGIIFFATTSCDGQKTISPSAVDATITAFVTTNFPQATITTCIKDCGEYEVMLSDGTKIDFDRSYVWESVDCEHSTSYTEVPEAIIPQAIKNYVATNYPNNYIRKISKDGKRWDIELNNGLDIEFDKNFNVIEIG